MYNNIEIVPASVELYDEKDVLKKIETIARTCTGTEFKSTGSEDFVRKLIEKGHESVLEHVHITVTWYESNEEVWAPTISTIMIATFLFMTETEMPTSLFGFDENLNADYGYGKACQYTMTLNLRTLRNLCKHTLSNPCGGPVGWWMRGVIEKLHPVFVSDMESSDMLGEDQKKFLEQGLKHASVELSKKSYTFRICTSRSTSVHFLRHRCISPTQESLRLTRKTGRTRITSLQAYDSCLKSHECLEAVCDEVYGKADVCKGSYDAMISESGYPAKTPPQVARHVIPSCIESPAYFTGTKKQWEYVLSLRSQPPADPQAIEISKMIRKLLDK